MGGDGVGRIEGWPVFIPSAAPGDRGEVEIESLGKITAGRWISLDHPSPLRRADTCSHSAVCGGCDWPFLSLETQVEWKLRLFRDTLRRIGKWSQAESFEIPVDRFPYGYRLRSQFKIGSGSSGSPAIGFFGKKSHDFFDIARCEVISPSSLDFVGRLREALRGASVLPEEVESVESVDGSQRALYISGRGLEPAAEDLFRRLAPLARGVVLFDAGSRKRIERGTPSVTIDVAGTPHRVSAESFFQVNRHALDTFVRRVEERLPEKVGLGWDLYCGTGFFSFPLARRSEKVLAVDSEGTSLADAKFVARKIGETRIRFFAQPVEKFLTRPKMTRPDVVILDPPRAGLSPRVRESLIALAPPSIVSVSCDAPTFARDLAGFVAAGYRVESLRLLDLFPGTYRVESVAHFRRG